jgi:rhodanese-related sulfurtransferase
MSQGYAGDLDPADAWALLEGEESAELIDVRTDAEWVFVGRPDLSALGKQVRFVPWQFFPTGQQNPDFVRQIEALELSKEQPLLFICRSGQRSAVAAKAMTAAGYGPCYNVAEGLEGDCDAEGHRGGTGGWKVAGLAWVQD